MKRLLLTIAMCFAASAAFANHSVKVPSHKPGGPPPSQEDMDALPKTTVKSANKHEAPPAPGTTVEQPK